MTNAIYLHSIADRVKHLSSEVEHLPVEAIKSALFTIHDLISVAADED